jgi:hypothetical protein
MNALILEPHLARADDFYQALIDAHRDLSDDESAALNARLILLLANHIGDFEVLSAALAEARVDARPEAGSDAQSTA